MVEVTEVQPVALWGERYWLNFTGDLVERESGSLIRNLPRLYGPQQSKQQVWDSFREWSDLFSKVGLDLDSLTLDARGLWYLELSLNALARNRVSTELEQNLIATRPVTMVASVSSADGDVKRTTTGST